MLEKTTRRNVLKNLLLTSSAIVAAPASILAACDAEENSKTLKGNINHSVCRWTYNFISLDELPTRRSNLPGSTTHLFKLSLKY